MNALYALIACIVIGALIAVLRGTQRKDRK